MVSPLPLSLATTHRISFDFFSSAYLDVSLRRVPFLKLWIYFRIHGSSPCGLPHSEICGYNAYLQLPAAYRSLSRPSSAPDAKAFTLCSFSLELPLVLSCLSFANNCFGCFLCFTTSQWQNCSFTNVLWKDLIFQSFLFSIICSFFFTVFGFQ